MSDDRFHKWVTIDGPGDLLDWPPEPGESFQILAGEDTIIVLPHCKIELKLGGKVEVEYDGTVHIVHGEVIDSVPVCYCSSYDCASIGRRHPALDDWIQGTDIPDKKYIRHNTDCPDAEDCPLHPVYRRGGSAQENARCLTCQCDEDDLSWGAYSEDCPRHQGREVPGSDFGFAGHDKDFVSTQKDKQDLKFYPAYICSFDDPCPNCDQTIYHDYWCVSSPAIKARLKYQQQKEKLDD